MPFKVWPSTRRSVGEELLGFCLHALLAITAGLLLVPTIVFGMLRALCFVASINLHDIPGFFQKPFGPISAIADVLFGFFLNRYLRHRSAPYIAVLGAAWLTTAVVWDYLGFGHSAFVAGHFWQYELDQLFLSNCGECLQQFFVTAPAMALVFYSIGAAVGLREQGRKTVPVP